MAVSVFDLFKTGIGPGSSHTVGPMRAARLFLQRLQSQAQLSQVARVECRLYGSLAATGKGHGSDNAVLLGLMGQDPESVPIDAIEGWLADIRRQGQMHSSKSTLWPLTNAATCGCWCRKPWPFTAQQASCPPCCNTTSASCPAPRRSRSRTRPRSTSSTTSA